jgi:hypothetical protein
MLAPMLENEQTNVRVAAVGRSFASLLFATRVTPDARSSADMHQNRSSSAYTVADLSALAPQSGNLFVRLTRGIRSP